MQYAFDRFRTEIAHALLNTGLVEPEEIELGPPTARGIQADLTLPCFRTARRRHDSPLRLAQQVATEMRESIQVNSLVGTAEASGGFVNFRVEDRALAAQVLGEIVRHTDGYGSDDRGAGRTVVIDNSSPNIAKRMHAGHIRSTIIGQALVNIFRAQGYTVVGDNHLGDWGKQFGVLLAAIDRRGLPQGEGEELLARFEQLYADFAKATERDPALDDEARRWSLRLEQGDPAAHEIWQRCVDLMKQVNQRNYDRLGVRFDTEHGESFYAHMTQQVIDDALSSGAARRDAGGAVIVDVAGLPTFLLQRSDGGTLYHTRDLATIKFRQDTYHPAKIIYVVGKPQELHFQQLFATARAMGYAPPGVELAHVIFGTVYDGERQPLSTRRGNMVHLETLLGEAVQRARELVEQKAGAREAALAPAEREAIAEAVGIGAAIYNDLYQDPKRNITLDWDAMFSLDGNSATYLQYMHTRCRSILRRAGSLPGAVDARSLVHSAEVGMVKALALLPLRVRGAADACAPSIVADWLYGAARQFSAFYRDCPVLNAPSPELRAARLHLVSATAQCLQNGLRLLGIQAPERM